MKKHVVNICLTFLLLFTFDSFVSAQDEVNFVIAPQFDAALEFSEGLAGVHKDGYWGFIDKTGNIVVEPQYDLVLQFSEGLAAVQRGDKWGFIDKTGQLVIQPQFDVVPFEAYFVGGFSEGLAAVIISDENWAYIDKTGRMVIDGSRFDHAEPFSEGLAAVSVSDQYGYIDKTGNFVIDPQYDLAEPFSEGIAAAYYHDHGWGFIDKTGEAFTGFVYWEASQFKEGLAPVEDGFIDTDGILVYDFVHDLYYDKADSFNDGVAVIYKINQGQFIYGFMDRNGQEIVMPSYLDVQPIKFNEGLGAIYEEGLWGFVDKAGQVVITPQFEQVGSHFSEGLAAVAIDGKWGYIGQPGSTVTLAPQPLPTTPRPSPTTAPVAPSPVAKPPVANTANQPSSWAVDEVEAALHAQLVPRELQQAYTQNINRAEFSHLIVSLFSTLEGQSVEEWLASMDGQWQQVFQDTNDPSVLAAYSLGIVNGKGEGRFDPYGDITRQEAAVMLQRAAAQLGAQGRPLTSTYADEGKIAAWASDGVRFVATLEDRTVNLAVMSGRADNTFDPLGKYTREQAIITLKRLFQALQ